MPGLVYFCGVRIGLRDGRPCLDPMNHRHVGMLVAPFREVTLVGVAGEAGPDWVPLPAGVGAVRAHPDFHPLGSPGTWRRKAEHVARTLALVPLARRLVRQADVVGLNWITEPTVQAGMLAARATRTPVYATVLGSAARAFAVEAGQRPRAVRPLYRAASALSRRIDAWLARRADLLLLTGERLAAEYGRGHAFGTALIEASDLHARPDTCQGDAITWAYHGGVGVHKGVDTLLRALALARQRDPRHRALLVGHLGERDDIPALIDELGLAGAVELTGRLPWAEALARLRAADVYVFLSLHEGLPKAPLEAMAQSLPVVVTPTGAEQHVTDGASGVVVPVGDARAVAEAVARIASDGAFRRSLVANGFAYAQANTVEASRARVAALVAEAFPGQARTGPSPW